MAAPVRAFRLQPLAMGIGRTRAVRATLLAPAVRSRAMLRGAARLRATGNGGMRGRAMRARPPRLAGTFLLMAAFLGWPVGSGLSISRGRVVGRSAGRCALRRTFGCLSGLAPIAPAFGPALPRCGLRLFCTLPTTGRGRVVCLRRMIVEESALCRVPLGASFGRASSRTPMAAARSFLVLVPVGGLGTALFSRGISARGSPASFEDLERFLTLRRLYHPCASPTIRREFEPERIGCDHQGCL